jgi:drug/metabolite transporter (DMT)-like permease
MPPLALALVIAAALLHALWNIAAKKAGGGAHFMLIVAAMVVVLWSPVGLWFAWREIPRWGLAEWGAVAASAAVHVVYFSTLLAGYRAADLTVVYPIARGTGPLLSSTGAVLLLGESLGAGGAAGVLAIALGVFLIAGGPGLARRVRDPAQRRRVALGIGWGAATGAAICAYTLIDGYAVKVLLISPIVVDWMGHALRVPLMLPASLRDRAGFRPALHSQWRHALLVALLSPLAYVLVLYAVTIAPLSHVAPAREVSMLFAALIGGHLLGEADRAWRLLGAACIAGGVVALALG